MGQSSFDHLLLIHCPFVWNKAVLLPVLDVRTEERGNWEWWVRRDSGEVDTKVVGISISKHVLLCQPRKTGERSGFSRKHETLFFAVDCASDESGVSGVRACRWWCHDSLRCVGHRPYKGNRGQTDCLVINSTIGLRLRQHSKLTLNLSAVIYPVTV